MKGIIIKGIAGFYYVRTDNQIYQCKARGIFKKNGITPFVGDEVIIEETDELDGEAVINEILPRKNSFIRPPIANVDCFVIVISIAKPKPNLIILDKFLVMAEKAHTKIIICFNKIDLDKDNRLEEIMKVYENLYTVVKVSGYTGEGIDELKKLLKGKKSAFAGPSGVGKSTLLNNLQEGFNVQTGEISYKTNRGKHTTRHVEIFELDFGGMIYDTPGFTSFDVLDAEEDELHYFYPEMISFIGQCKYDNCRHIKEPDCRIREAVDSGKIHKSRYNSYVTQYNEIKEKRKKYYD
ncbi:ribosome small subunit-dependent GTPase A [Anaerovorax odorimutans]|uniref:ribosome small subunit-dependent GTPase A n=1 Tax=Anaerovorax odorimutans TaxID=109327 RepID=UPI00041299C3|nr:ribosome small subunit-dependent GTPase A [Anaerovorax odorimutans]